MVTPFLGVDDSLRWTRGVLVEVVVGRRWGCLLCRRVFTTSNGCTASVEIVPAERPAMVSTSAGERRAWFSVIGELLRQV